MVVLSTKHSKNDVNLVFCEFSRLFYLLSRLTSTLQDEAKLYEKTVDRYMLFKNIIYKHYMYIICVHGSFITALRKGIREINENQINFVIHFRKG